MIRVSVVIPAFNAADWLPAALASVRAQTWPLSGIDVVVVDDGSTDDSAAVAGQILSASAIEHAILRNPESIGPSGARNLGWRRGRGDWIQFLDADDVLDPGKIAHQAPMAIAAPAETAMVYSRWGRQDPSGEQWIARDQVGHEPVLRPDAILSVMATENALLVGSQLFRREWLERVNGFDDRHRWIEDVDLALRLLMNGATFECAPSERPLYWYRSRPGSLSRSSLAGFFEGSARNARLAEDFWSRRGELTPERRQWLASHYFSCARVLAEHNPAQLDALVERIYRLSPEFVPPHKGLRALTRLVGYAHAERLAVRYRRVRQMFSDGNDSRSQMLSSTR